MEHRSVFGDIDVISGEHRCAPFFEPGLPCELDQKAHGLRRYAVLRVIEVDASCLGTESLCTFGILRKKVAKVSTLDAFVVRSELLERRSLSEWAR